MPELILLLGGSDFQFEGQVIVRTIATAIPEAKLDQSRKYIRANILPSYEEAPGLVMVWLLERPFVAYMELVLFSIWKTSEEMSSFFENHPPDPVLSSEGFIHLEPRTYELMESRVGTYARGDPAQL